MKTGNSALAIFFWLWAFLYPAFYYILETFGINNFFNYLRDILGLNNENFVLLVFLFLIILGTGFMATGIEYSFDFNLKPKKKKKNTKKEKTSVKQTKKKHEDVNSLADIYDLF